MSTFEVTIIVTLVKYKVFEALMWYCGFQVQSHGSLKYMYMKKFKTFISLLKNGNKLGMYTL